MGIFTNGLRLLSVLRRPEDERKEIYRIYTNAHTWDDVAKLGKGEVVRQGSLIGIVVRQKSAEQDGLVVLVCSSKFKWYYKMSYCPYLHELAYSGSCGLVTEAISKDDGMANQRVIEGLMRAEKEANMNRSIAMPPADQRSFPAFETCSCSGDNAYLPALNELLLLADDKELFGMFARLEKGLACSEVMDADGRCRMWTSTDAQHHYSDDDSDRSYSDAYAVSISSDGKPETLSLRKTEEAWCIPFCRF